MSDIVQSASNGATIHLSTIDLAARYQTTPRTIHQTHSRNPDRLPPALNLGGRKLLWRLCDVEAWEEARVGVAAPAQAASRQRGRPGRKSVAAKARAAAAAAWEAGVLIVGGMTANELDSCLALSQLRIDILLRKQSGNSEIERDQEAKMMQPTSCRLDAWPDAVRAVPNCFLRSALFGAIANGKRQYFDKNVRLATVDGIELPFKGDQLDQGELDVWETVLHVVRTQDLGSECRLTSYALLQLMGLTDAGPNMKTLEERIARLVGCTVTLRQGRYKYIGHLICSAATDTATKQWVISIDPNMRSLFEADQFTQIDWAVRRKLARKPLAQWLHGFYSSHAKRRPQRCFDWLAARTRVETVPFRPCERRSIQ